MKQIGIVLLFILLSVFSSLAQQSINQANDEKVKPPKYKVGQTHYTTDGGRSLLVFAAISERSFNNEKMLALAKRLKLDYPNEDRLGVYFFDDFTAAKRFIALRTHNPTYEKDMKALRGYYSFDRTKTTEYIEYSPQRGKPEIRLNVNNSTTHQ